MEYKYETPTVATAQYAFDDSVRILCGNYKMTILMAESLILELEAAVERGKVLEGPVAAEELTYCCVCGNVSFEDEPTCDTCAQLDEEETDE